MSFNVSRMSWWIRDGTELVQVESRTYLHIDSGAFLEYSTLDWQFEHEFSFELKNVEKSMAKKNDFSSN